jgi:hypothetical protein
MSVIGEEEEHSCSVEREQQEIGEMMTQEAEGTGLKSSQGISVVHDPPREGQNK